MIIQIEKAFLRVLFVPWGLNYNALSNPLDEEYIFRLFTKRHFCFSFYFFSIGQMPRNPDRRTKKITFVASSITNRGKKQNIKWNRKNFGFFLSKLGLTCVGIMTWTSIRHGATKNLISTIFYVSYGLGENINESNPTLCHPSDMNKKQFLPFRLRETVN